MNLTKGGLSPATLTNTKTNKIVNFMFNPTEFTITKSVSWSDGEDHGVNAPKSIFDRGQARTLSLTLYFDTQKAGTDVQNITKDLWAMSLIDPSSVNSTTQKGMPPPVNFRWGRVFFRAIITQISEKYTLFDERGTPLRSEIGIELKEYIPGAASSSSGAGAGGGAGAGASAGGSAPSTVTQVGSDRPDNLASQNGGNPSDYRQLCSDNNVDNPKKIKSGTKLQKKG